jgi:hypothetical protein
MTVKSYEPLAHEEIMKIAQTISAYANKAVIPACRESFFRKILDKPE